MNSRREVAKMMQEESTPRYYQRGNFTVAILTWRNREGVGVSKFNPNDKAFKNDTGIRKAYGRALTDLTDRVWEEMKAVPKVMC